jgi:hypothetical protein
VAIVFACLSSVSLAQQVSSGQQAPSDQQATPGQPASPGDGTQTPAAAKAPEATPKTGDNTPPVESKRLFGIIPNFRTSPSLDHYEPITAREKFKIASQDSFDRGTVVLALLFAGDGQLTNSNKSFGQGALGFSRYAGSAYGDFLIGDYMTEAVFPTLLHQDPRYFRRGTGSGKSRLGYAMGQIFWTHRDSGGTQFNYSEVLGNSAAVAISNAYYVDDRTASKAVSKLVTQIGVDMAANILKEFWPDLSRKFSRKHGPNTTASHSD